MKKEFENTTAKSPLITPAQTISVDAINFIMDNIFDWESQKTYAGLRVTYEDCKTLVKSLKLNLTATCPDVRDEDATGLYAELLHNNWAGELQDIKELTEKLVSAYLEAELGNLEPITTLKRQMKGKINFMEAHYSDVSHKDDVPMHILAETMEKKGGFSANLEGRKNSVMALIQEKRGHNGDLLDGENDPALLAIIKALSDAATDQELIDALESFEDYLVQDDLKAAFNTLQPAAPTAGADQEKKAPSLAARIKQKLPALSRFFMS